MSTMHWQRKARLDAKLDIATLKTAPPLKSEREKKVKAFQEWFALKRAGKLPMYEVVGR